MKRKPTGHRVLLNMWATYDRETSERSRSDNRHAGSMPMERSGDNCKFRHDGPLNKKGKARARRDSARAHAWSSWNSRQSEYTDVKEETRKTKKRAGTFAYPQDWTKFMQRAASAKIKVEADEKLHHRVRRNDICMMMGVSQHCPRDKIGTKRHIIWVGRTTTNQRYRRWSSGIG